MQKIITLILLLLSIRSTAQQMECATDLAHSFLMQTDSNYRNLFINNENLLQSTIQKNETQSNVVYTIPVVVHVIHLGESVGTGTNISDAQIINAITGLNNRWRNLIGSGVDMEIQFCLATTDPNGASTTGINRVNGAGVPSYSSYGILVPGCSPGADQEAVKSLSRWPVNKYYNIWVVNKICNGNWGGWTYYPFGDANDGATIASIYMKQSDPLLTHEVGHGFFGYHTFEGDGGNVSCPTNTDCTTMGDRVCDTPPHKQGDCNTNVCGGSGTWNNTLYNYMSYCGITDRFTQGQKDRLRAAATTSPRSSLLTSNGCASTIGVSKLFSEKNISVFPNPSDGHVTIKTAEGTAEIKICDTTGKIVFQSTAIKEIMELSTLPQGIYFMTATTRGNLTYNERVIIF